MTKYYLILISLLTILLSGCAESKKYRIGVSQCSSDDWRSKMNNEIEREILLHPEAEVEIRSAEDDSKHQIEDIKYFVDNDFDIIIVAPNEAAGLTPAISEAYNKGVPVIVFDRDINGNDYTARQTVDNDALGARAADYAATLFPGGAKVIEIRGLDGATPAEGRSRGFARNGERHNFSIVASAAGNWQDEKAAAVADSMLSLHPDAALIYAHNDRMAIAASQVARKKGLNVRVIGIDGAPEIGIRAVADGIIDATFIYSTAGEKLIRTALAILKGEKFEQNAVIPNTSAVDKSNADILLQQNEQLQDETEKITTLKSQVDDYWTRHSAQTTLFYAAVIILVLLCILLFLMLRTFWTNKRHQKELMEQNKLLEQQRDNEIALNEQLNLATQAKLIFFTNVSHDLRTPLTLISEPVEQLAAAGNLDDAQRGLIKIADKNVKILRRLINQILDFRKYENGRQTLNLTEASVAELMREWSESFSATARKRALKLNVDIDLPDNFTMGVDAEKLERIFFNLLSNAIKYTPQGGKINLTVRIENNNLILTVKDTGRGIASDDLNNIFDRFYQVDKIHPNGSGIGLSLVKAFIELHEGTITAESEIGKGSLFTVTLPVKHVEHQNATTAYSPVLTPSEVSAELSPVESAVPQGDESLPVALVIDDNADIREMIKILLADRFRFLEAENGKEGVALATRFVPDIIICDIMMPVMDGIECCRLIKNEMSTAHIPVLMLTACAMDQQRIQGYESGADAYLSKPFDAETLRSRCRNLIEGRERLRKLWNDTDNPLNLTHNSAKEETSEKKSLLTPEKEFFEKFRAIVFEKISDPELSVDALAGEMGMGRSQFYRKLKAISGYSPVELLRNLRLAKARELLLTSDLSVSEIAYAVGFASPAYFTRCYRTLYNETPTEVRGK